MIDNIKDSIKIPDNLDKHILNGMEEGKAMLIKEKRKKNIKRASIAAVAALTVTTSTFVLKPELTSAIPIIGRVFEYFKEDYREYPIDKYKELGKVIGQTVEGEGGNITLEQVVLDDNIFVSSFHIQSDKLYEVWNDNVKMKNINETIKINGIEILCDTSLKIISENEAMVIVKSNISSLNLDDEVDIDIILNSITNSNNEEIVGPWEFSFNTVKDINNKEYVINKSLPIDIGEIFIEKLNYSPISAKIFISGKHFGGEENRDKIEKLNYIVKDNNGNLLDVYFDKGSVNLDGNYRTQLDVIGDLTSVEFIDVIINTFESEVDKENKIRIYLEK